MCSGFLFLGSVPDVEPILNEADGKLSGVREKIGQIAEELRGEDIYQFHRAFTAGKFLALKRNKKKNVEISFLIYLVTF